MNRKGKKGQKTDDLDDEQALVRQMMFGDDAMKIDQDESDDDDDGNGDGDDSDDELKDGTKKKVKKDLSAYTMAVIIRSSGTMQIYKVPSFEMVFECKEIHLGHELLKNGLIHDNSLPI